MKLRNKKTGEIIELDHISAHYSRHYDYGEDKSGELSCFTWNKTLAELNDEWEDYEQPKDDAMRVIDSFIQYVEEADDSFCCDESVQKFIEKLKAWKRLKDKGFKFNGYELFCGRMLIDVRGAVEVDKKDLDLLFGGEE